jgi:hypothetical protein
MVNMFILVNPKTNYPDRSFPFDFVVCANVLRYPTNHVRRQR